MKVLLDINVVLDVFLARDPWLADSSAVVQAGLDGKVAAYLSAASLPTIFYIVRHNASLARAHAVIKECLDTFSNLSVDRTTLEMAITFPGSDFEDNLQIACAVEATLDAIVTRNPKDFAGSPVLIMTPAELLALLAKAPGA
jgi:predicted nucleic acid-binding protein